MERPEFVLAGEDFRDTGYYGWDDNGAAIPLFPSFCKESCQLEMGKYEVYSPVAIIRRDGSSEGLKTHFIRKMLRPWRDGVRPFTLVRDGQVCPPTVR